MKMSIILSADGIYGKIGTFITDANTKYCVVHFLEYTFRTFGKAVGLGNLDGSFTMSVIE